MESHEALKRPQEEEANGGALAENNGTDAEPAMKRVKLDGPSSANSGAPETVSRTRAKGVAPIKEEYGIACSEACILFSLSGSLTDRPTQVSHFGTWPQREAGRGRGR